MLQRLALPLLLSLSSCAAPDTTPLPPPGPFASETERLNAWLELVYEQELMRSPMDLTRRGRKERQDEWDDLSDEAAWEAYEATKLNLATLIREFRKSALDPQGRLSYQLFQYRSERAIERFPYRLHGYPVNQMYGVHTAVPSLLTNAHRVETVQDAEDYVTRLERVGEYLDPAVDDLRRRAEIGILAPKFVFPKVLSDCRNLLTGRPFQRDAGRDSTLLADFRAKVGGLRDHAPEEAEDLVEQASEALLESVGPAYQRLIAALEELEAEATADAGAWKLPDGDAYYAMALRHTTTTTLGPDEIHELGLTEVARIQREMRLLQERIGFPGDLDAFFEHLRKEPELYYSNDDAGRQQYLARVREIVADMRGRLPALFGTLPRAELVVKRVEPYRERSAGKAFYEAGTPDGRRPGTYYANLYDMRDMPIYQMRALAYHEGIPGHHLQGSIAQELRDIPKFRRFSSYTAYGEGWGLYSELLPKELGLYEDPYEDFGRLAMELWRACRLVVDTGLHHKRWTREEAVVYLMENTPNPDGDCVKAVDRYVVMPGQATAYKIGMMRILELRKWAKQRLGRHFDLRGFHDAVLTNGPLPLDLLRSVVEDWVVDVLREQERA